MTKYRTLPTTLDRAYHNWHCTVLGRNSWNYSYQKTYRLDNNNQKFESWVQAQGGLIKQENRQRYVEFDDEGLRMQFMLTWGS